MSGGRGPSTMERWIARTESGCPDWCVNQGTGCHVKFRCQEDGYAPCGKDMRRMDCDIDGKNWVEESGDVFNVREAKEE